MAEDRGNITAGQALSWMGVGLAGYLGYTLLHSLGIIKTPKDKKEEAEEAAAVARFDEYAKYTTDAGFLAIAKQWKLDHNNQPLPTSPAGAGTKLICGNNWQTLSPKIAKGIYDSKGTFDDDEDLLYARFREMETVGGLWAVNRFFQLHKKQDVMDYVREFTSDEERAAITRILDEKPFYTGGTRK